MTRPLRDSTEAEIQALSDLCDRLVNFGARCSPEYTDGFLTALAAGLTVPPFAEWIVPLAGDEFERTFADPEDRALAELTLSARLAVLREQLDPESLDEWPDQLRLSPLMTPWTDEDRAEIVAGGKITAEDAAGLVTGADWADGFMDALTAFQGLWPAAGDEDMDVLGGLTMQVHALRLDEGSDALQQHIAITYGKAGADRDTLIDSACFAVQDMRLWAVDHAPKPETRRVDKTPGRNDPCPCGSGKKFKKCHGA